MTLRVVSADEFRGALILDAADDMTLRQVVADHWRWAVWRLGLTSQGVITRHLRARLEVADVPAERAQEVIRGALEGLLEVGDVAKVRASAATYLAPVEPRIIPMGDTTSALVGSLPTRLVRATLSHHDGSLARWFSSTDATAVAALQRAGALEWPLQAWVGVPYILARRGAAEPQRSLDAAWHALVHRLSGESLRVDQPERLCVVGGEPDTYFGFAHELSGRWKAPSIPGAWVGRRPGQREGHTHPTLVFVNEDGAVRCADFHDEEEYSWALLARGAACGSKEVIRLEVQDGRVAVRCSFPPPPQVRRLLSLCGAPKGPWRWTTTEEVRPQLERVLQSLGISTTQPPPHQAPGRCTQN